MSSHAKPTTATVIPCLRYRNAPAMIERLCKAFGFEKHAVYADGDVVQHAQRGYGGRDPEGHLWWFGDYDPWADQPT